MSTMAARGTPNNMLRGGTSVPPMEIMKQVEQEEDSSSSYVSTDPEEYMDAEYREAQAQALNEFNKKLRTPAHGKKKKKKSKKKRNRLTGGSALDQNMNEMSESNFGTIKDNTGASIGT